MRIIVAGVGRLKDGAEKTLFDRYWGRLDGMGTSVGLGPIKFCEVAEGKAGRANERRRDEAVRLAKAVGDIEFSLALDEHGKAMSSTAFATLLHGQVDDGCKSLAFYLGGPDGHDVSLLQDANRKLSLGPMTLPHGLARVVLVEQLYRAATILAGHPYHRE